MFGDDRSTGNALDHRHGPETEQLRTGEPTPITLSVSLSFIDLDSTNRINPEMHDRAKLVWEMIMVKEDLKCMTDLQFSLEDVAMFIEWCCTY